MNHHSPITKKYYAPLIGSALLAASLLGYSQSVFAAGTEAGTILRNTATGKYQDDAGNEYTIDSNTVNVTVAKVAGITNQPSGITDETSDADNTSVVTGDEVSFEFTITNVGNDVSNIYIPNAGNIATRGLDGTNLTVEVSQVNPGDSPTFADYSTLTDGVVEDVPANGQVIVRVTGTVTATIAGAVIEVQLGDTGSNTAPNAPVADTQNQFDNGQDTSDGSPDALTADNEVRTLNPTTPTAGVTDLPADEQKEASAVQRVFLNSNPLAFALIEKTRELDAANNAVNTDTDLTNNIITYNLDLEVLSTTPNAQFTPGNLSGRDFGGRITGVTDADASNLILISIAIPAGTVIRGAAATVTTPVGAWTPVYATGAEPAPNNTENLAADQLTWTTTFPAANPETVTRVGWIYDARATASGSISVSTSLTGFTFDVVTSGVSDPDNATIVSIAQVFGSTEGANDEVFDESGDQDPSNFTGVNPGITETDSLSTGIADPVNQGVDSENNNNLNGTDPLSPGGEVNLLSLATGTLFNGPNGSPTATGTIFGVGPNSNHDFQNLGVSNFDDIADGAQHNEGQTFDPEAVTFTNTLNNPGGVDLNGVLLQPVPPSTESLGGTNTNLPEDTRVTIRLSNGDQAVYLYEYPTTAGNTEGVHRFRLLSPAEAGVPSEPIRIDTLTSNVSLNYDVIVDLPDGTGLSTDDAVNHGFPVPVVAYVDNNSNGTPDTGNTRNYTVNQVYTGFVQISKEVAVFEPDGTTARTGGSLPGDIIEYTVNYRNISEAQTGTGNNLILNGTDITIDENGTLNNITTVTDGNNWALDNNGDDDLDTINVQNSATDSNSGTITYYTGTSPADSTDEYSVGTLIPAGNNDPGDTVTGYRVEVPLLAPSTTNSTFTFRRRVDEFDGLADDIDNQP